MPTDALQRTRVYTCIAAADVSSIFLSYASEIMTTVDHTRLKRTNKSNLDVAGTFTDVTDEGRWCSTALSYDVAIYSSPYMILAVTTHNA